MKTEIGAMIAPTSQGHRGLLAATMPSRREASEPPEGNNPVDTSISDFRPPDWTEQTAVVFSRQFLLVCWAALGNSESDCSAILNSLALFQLGQRGELGGHSFPLYSGTNCDPLFRGCAARLLSSVLPRLYPQPPPGICFLPRQVQCCCILNG